MVLSMAAIITVEIQMERELPGAIRQTQANDGNIAIAVSYSIIEYDTGVVRQNVCT